MADTGLVTAGAGANNADAGNTAWSNTGNITTATDSAYAEATNTAKSGTTQYLHATNFNFSAIPSGSTIDGIFARVRGGQGGTGGQTDNTIQLLIGGTRSGSNLAVGGNWTAAAHNRNYGGASNLWGLTPTDAQVKASDFGLAIRTNNLNTVGTISPRVYYVQIQIYYTEPEGNAGAFFALFNVKDRLRDILKPKKRFWLPEPAFARAA